MPLGWHLPERLDRAVFEIEDWDTVGVRLYSQAVVEIGAEVGIVLIDVDKAMKCVFCTDH